MAAESVTTAPSYPEEGAMLRFVIAASSGLEALFGLSALLATATLVVGLGGGTGASAVLPARILGSAARRVMRRS